ncbi:uncharacterized protein LOC127434585 [Myxocyprinus asiaticus]|uniref:uncharacterized protein LOC127434585 n=1 Tax=Myxocyprinus asiaticus TaxID=70543 RepID=UPI002221CF07|nr:uncharacterized protein LOC127434585 [Myxocyprinus asiaticus]
MVIGCAYFGCLNLAKPVRLRPRPSSHEERLTFHRFPISDPERLTLWLLATRRDLNTPIEYLKVLRVCSEHFSPADFQPTKGNTRRFLKSTAVPVFLQRTEEIYSDPFQPSQYYPAADNDEKTEVLGAGAFLAGVPQSTVRQKNIGQLEETQSELLLVLTSPESVGHRTLPSTSGTYFALPPIRSYQSLSLVPPSDKKELSFVPLSSTSTSSPTAEEEAEVVHWKERKWIVNESSVMEMFRRCQECGAPVTETKTATSGSLIRVQWECDKRHHGQWSSCSDVRGMPANNLLVSASAVFTGATYADIADWATLLNLQVPNKTTFYALQSSYLIPVIDAAYREQQTTLLDQLRIQNLLQKGVHLSGDGRSDSPGTSAKYNTYSLMDDTTDKIVHFELVQDTEASSSIAMEPIGFKRGLSRLVEQGIKIDVVTTDRSPSIRKIMRVDYPDIHHEFDICLVVKGLFKKLLSVSRYKDNHKLQPWIKCICNHLWYSCATCGGDPDDLTQKWKSILYHICGEHSWIEDGRQCRCLHNDLSPDQQRRKRWLEKESRAFHTLKTLVLDKGLLKDLRQMALFKHTSKLELFHSLLVKYCQKNLHFHNSSMVARTQLAILDYNENAHCQQATTTSGVPRYNGVFPEHSKEWVAKKQFEPTTQKFRDGLVQKVLERRKDPNVFFEDQSSHLTISKIPLNTAQETKPDKQEAISIHLSEFGK